MNAIKKIKTIVISLAVMSLMTLAACEEEHGHSLPEIDCESVTPPAFADVGLFGWCTSCHSSEREGGGRHGAPVGIDFDIYQAAADNAEHAVEQVNAGRMPPGGALPEETIEPFYAWALCGQPQ